jgi:NAD-dependent dihydropyrimidine dehydrogenase PreA subunit
VDLCEQGVLEIPENGMEPVVAHPERCVDGCTLCVDACRMDAIRLTS